MADRTLDAATIRTLCEAGRFDFVENEEWQFDNAIDDMLSGNGRYFRAPSVSMLAYLGRSLNASAYRLAFMDVGPNTLRDTIQKYYGFDSGGDPRALTGKVLAYANYEKCLQFVETVNREMLRPLLDWRSDLEPWNLVVETGRSLWGDRRALRHIATFASSVNIKVEPSDCFDLLDQSRPLCERTRCAAVRASDSRFWKRYLESRTQGEDRVFLCLLCAALADLNSIAQNAECLGQALDALDASDWQWVYNSARFCANLPAQRARKKSTQTKVSEVSKNISVRAACILCMRTNEKGRVKIYRRLLYDRQDQDEIALQFALEKAHDIKRFGTEKWTPDLAEIRKCYTRGAGSGSIPFELERRRPKLVKLMQLATATQVADAPLDYPSFLIAMVQERCRAEVARQIVPVADVAKRDHWFDH
jgi:hypothetical protein